MSASLPERPKAQIPMATALDIAKLNSNAAPLAATDAARHAGIEKMAELVVPARVPGKISLVGLTRDELAQRLAEIGVPEGEFEDARGAALALDLPARRAVFRHHVECRQGLAPKPRGNLYARSAASRLRAGVEGRHPQVADPDGLDRPPRQGRRDRMRLHPRGRPRARCACRARSAARSPAPSATPARSAWCAT